MDGENDQESAWRLITTWRLSSAAARYKRRPMEQSDQYFRTTLLAGETVKRLQREGYSTEEAKRLVTAVINAEEFAVMKGRHSFDEGRISERLRQLPN